MKCNRDDERDAGLQMLLRLFPPSSPPTVKSLYKQISRVEKIRVSIPKEHLDSFQEVLRNQTMSLIPAVTFIQTKYHI